MKISNANFTYELPHQHVTDIALPPVSSQSKGKVSIVVYILHSNKSFLFLPLPDMTAWIVLLLYTGCPRRNVKYFGRVFLMLNYTDITQNTYIQS